MLENFIFVCLSYLILTKTCTVWSRNIYPSKNSIKNNTRRRMKKCFYKKFQNYSQNIMNRLNFEVAAFCAEDESEKDFH